MRRKEKEVTDRREIESILGKATICRIAMCQDHQPYLVPMSYGYSKGYLYLHSAKEGKKIDVLRENPMVCFEVTENIEIAPAGNTCNWSVKYRSVIGIGKVLFLEEPAEKIRALDTIMAQHTGQSGHEYTEQSVTNVQLLAVEISEVSGKVSGY